jgi:condensin complex subunit 1
MVLGMMAIAKKSILEDHVELMLKVGLGKLGRVGSNKPHLIRYTHASLSWTWNLHDTHA